MTFVTRDLRRIIRQEVGNRIWPVEKMAEQPNRESDGFLRGPCGGVAPGGTRRATWACNAGRGRFITRHHARRLRALNGAVSSTCEWLSLSGSQVTWIRRELSCMQQKHLIQKRLSAARVLFLWACRRYETLGFCLRLPHRAGAPSSWSESEALMRLCYRERMTEGGQSRPRGLISDVIDLVNTPFVYTRGKEVSTGVLPSRQSRGKVLK